MEGEALLGELRRVLSYDPVTGAFRWLIRTHGYGGVKDVGSEAGALKDGYIKITYTDSEGVRHQLRAHRLAWWFVKGVLPKEIDHDDNDRANNAWPNLRDATRTQNNLNAGLRSDNASGKRGVSWVEIREKWLARLIVHGRIVYQREFAELEDAIAARKAAELEHVGRLSPS